MSAARAPKPPVTRPVTSPDDPRLEPFRAVADPERVRRRGLFVAEGRRVVEDILRSGGYEVRGLLLTRSAREALAPLVDRLACEVLVVEGPAALRDVTGHRFHQGCIALADLPAGRSLEGILAPGSRKDAPLVVLEGVTDPDNVGTVFRSARAFGARGVLLGPGCAHPLYRKALRTSLGAALRLPFVHAASWPEDLVRVREAGFTRLALTPSANAVPLSDLLPRMGPGAVALLLGGEERGLSCPALENADIRSRIDHEDAVDSLNVAAAAAIALHGIHAHGRCQSET